MESIDELCRRIERLYQEHRAAPFPKECYANEQVNGTSLVMLDADIVGCVCTFVKNDFSLDLWRTAVLGSCYRSVALVLPHLPEGARFYFTRLETLTGFVLQAVGRQAKDNE